MPENPTETASISNPLKPKNPSQLTYRDGSVRLFVVATVFWGVFATFQTILSGLLLSLPSLFGNLHEAFQPLVTFARIDSLRSNLAILAFGGNAVFAGIYYSIQRLCKAQLWSHGLALLHFFSWQAILVALTAATIFGYVQSGSLSGAPLAIDLAIALVWICFFGFNCAMTIANRRERFLYVSLWFYLSSIIAVSILQIANCLASPTGGLRSEPLFLGAQSAWLSNWYKQGISSFLLTMPYVGLMYYFLPKGSDRPLFSYKLTIVHFWSLVLLFLCDSSNRLHYTTVPEWASTLGMLCGVMLWMPSWAGVVNGWCTLSGAWHRVKQDPALRFMFAGLLVFGFTSLEASILSVKSVHALIHYSDWEVAHWDTFMMGWIGLTTFGMIYWLMPRLVRCNLTRSSYVHFYLAVAGLLLTVVPEYASGFVQARKWSQLSEMGKLQYSFIETLQSVSGLWWIRLFGQAVYLLGLLVLAAKMLFLLSARSTRQVSSVPPALSVVEGHSESPVVASALIGKPVLELASKLDQFAMLHWHRKLERQPARLALMIGLIVCLISFFQIALMLASQAYVAPIGSVQPFTPLEQMGRAIYISQGCQQCHSQMVRPLVYESQRYGAISQAGESIFDRPTLWGEHRVGPDLAREGGGKQSSFWHWRHFENPPTMTKETVMPTYKHLLTSKLSFLESGTKPQSNHLQGTDSETADSQFKNMAIKQAEVIAAEIIGQGGPVAYEGNFIKDTSAVALIAYIQRLGTDLSRPSSTTSSSETNKN